MKNKKKNSPCTGGATIFWDWVENPTNSQSNLACIDPNPRLMRTRAIELSVSPYSLSAEPDQAFICVGEANDLKARSLE